MEGRGQHTCERPGWGLGGQGDFSQALGPWGRVQGALLRVSPAGGCDAALGAEPALAPPSVLAKWAGFGFQKLVP